MNLTHFCVTRKLARYFTQLLVTEFRQPLQVRIHLEMTGILVQLGHIQRT